MENTKLFFLPHLNTFPTLSWEYFSNIWVKGKNGGNWQSKEYTGKSGFCPLFDIYPSNVGGGPKGFYLYTYGAERAKWFYTLEDAYKYAFNAFNIENLKKLEIYIIK